MTDENSDRRERPKNRNYSDRKPRYNGESGGKDGFRKGGYGSRDRSGSGEKRNFNKGPRRDGDRPRKPYGQRDGERKPYRPREGSSDDKGGERRSYGDKPYGNRERSYGDRPRREHSDRPYGQRDGERKPYGKPRGDRPYGNRDGERRSYGDRPRREHSDRPYNNRDGERKPYRPREDREEEPRREAPKIRLPEDPQKLLFKGVDLRENGKLDLAMVMFLHGSVKMSKGCENNALNILRDGGKDGMPVMRASVAENCSEDAMTEFDYLCFTLDPEYDRSYFDRMFSENRCHAIYRRICLGEIEGDDDAIDTFASFYAEEPDKVNDGLKLLSRKKESAKADAHLERIAAKKQRRQDVHNYFVTAVKGNDRSLRELKKLSSEFPEAAFFANYIKAKNEGRAEAWLKEKYPEFSELIITEECHLGLRDTPYGLFLRAKNLQAKKEEWIPAMIKAVRYGSEDALEELQPLMYRADIMKQVASIHLADRDLPALMRIYRSGLQDTYYLEQFCQDNDALVLQVAEEFGQFNKDKELDWLEDHSRKGMARCREAIIARSENEEYRSKRMIYALHDIGEDLKSAQMYFSMDPAEVPAVKWLRKVCETEEAKEFVRAHYEEIGETETFESIFIDDGYVKNPYANKKKPFKKRR